MWKKIAYSTLLVGVVAAAAAVGCSSGGGPTDKPDFATPGDGGPAGDGGDMNVMKAYMTGTPHEIDTNTIGGTFGKGAAVQVAGLIAITPVSGFSANSNKDCKYEVWAQDPACTTAPCGILLVTAGITNPGGTGQFCSFSYAAMTSLKNVQKGDKLDVKGVVDTFSSTGMASDMTPSGTVVQHEIALDEVTIVMSGQALPAATVVTDANPSLFVPYSGTGWAMYEGMLISLKPASGKFTTTLDAFGGWNCAPGGAHFADTFTTFFRPDGAAANMYPASGSMFSSIQGVVGLTFGGGILPTNPSDFVP